MMLQQVGAASWRRAVVGTRATRAATAVARANLHSCSRACGVEGAGGGAHGQRTGARVGLYVTQKGLEPLIHLPCTQSSTATSMGGHRGSGVKTCDVTSLGDHVLKAINAGSNATLATKHFFTHRVETRIPNFTQPPLDSFVECDWRVHMPPPNVPHAHIPHVDSVNLTHLLVTDSFTTITRAALVIDDLALVPVINRLLATNKVLEQVNIFCEAGIAAQVHDNLRSSVANRVRLRNLHQLHEHIITSVEEFHATAPALDYLAMFAYNALQTAYMKRFAQDSTNMPLSAAVHALRQEGVVTQARKHRLTPFQLLKLFPGLFNIVGLEDDETQTHNACVAVAEAPVLDTATLEAAQAFVAQRQARNQAKHRTRRNRFAPATESIDATGGSSFKDASAGADGGERHGAGSESEDEDHDRDGNWTFDSRLT